MESLKVFDLLQIGQNENVIGFGRNFNLDKLQLIKIQVPLKLIKVEKSISEGFWNLNLAGNFQKRIKRAARFLDRLE